MNAITANTSGYASVNGIDLYYEIYGAGQPTILLHGGLGNIMMFTSILPQLAEGRQVIGVELQAHGHTADIDRPMTFEALADDIAALITHLGIEQADVIGYSLGGMVAQNVALRYPQLVRKLVVMSAPCKREGWHTDVVASMSQINAEVAESLKQSPMYGGYAMIAPRVEDWSTLVTKMGDLLRMDYDWSDEIAKLSLPILILVGDSDSVHLAHAVEFYRLFGGDKQDANWDRSGKSRNAQLAVLPDMTHYEIFMSPATANTMIAFLDKDES